MLSLAPWIGYLASVLLIISLTMSQDIKLRWFNLAGSACFVVYGILLNAIPVAATNFILLVINVYYIRKIHGRKAFFEAIAFRGDEQMAAKFLSFYEKQIRAAYPDFRSASFQNNLNCVVLADLSIAGMCSALPEANGEACMQLQYTVRQYRDAKSMRQIWERQKDFLCSKGVKTVFFQEPADARQRSFLMRLGARSEDRNGMPVLAFRIG